jgi:glycosyltransferase involved in cell wall biosynthesis
MQKIARAWRSEMNTKVTIGLCVKDAAKVVKTAFHSISVQDYPHQLLKLVIVDDGSSDNTLALAMEFARETDIKTFVTSSKGKRLGATRQVAVDNAEGDYILWVDDDLMLSKDFIRNEVEFMERNPAIGAAQGAEIPAPPETIIGICEYGVLAAPHLRNPKAIGTGGSIFRLKALENAGGFDTRIKGAGEDLDISHRIRESGWTLATINSAKFRVKDPPSTLKALLRKHYWFGYANHFLFHKHKEKGFVLEYFPPITLLLGVRNSYLISRLTNTKNGFVFVILHSIITIAKYSGFIKSHIDAYGHALGKT